MIKHLKMEVIGSLLGKRLLLRNGLEWQKVINKNNVLKQLTSSNWSNIFTNTLQRRKTQNTENNLSKSLMKDTHFTANI